jgi:hypothetical protein
MIAIPCCPIVLVERRLSRLFYASLLLPSQAGISDQNGALRAALTNDAQPTATPFHEEGMAIWTALSLVRL